MSVIKGNLGVTWDIVVIAAAAAVGRMKVDEIIGPNSIAVVIVIGLET